MKPWIVALALASACGHRSSDAPAPGAGSADHYTVRGRLTGLPAGAASTEIEVNSERIPAFKAADGKVAPMESMPMEYEVGPGVSLSGLAAGDPIEMTFEVHWDAKEPLRVTKLAKLPADTKLALP